ncbi:cancer/testis antigen 55-like [Sapajus apella]|uniref:Cancer/testis antigen 55-like n=1 Tax=Sapajus apella TaxID=9515 RepID=A0A6J3GQA5_SAPAP|nr:cancer/testis antigen 55-like [Sapajus apella]
MLRLLRQALAFFQRKADPTQRQGPQQQGLPQGGTTLKTVQGFVTNVSSNYGLINELNYSSSDIVTDNVALKVGQKVTAVAKEDKPSHGLKAIKIGCDEKFTLFLHLTLLNQ